MKNKKGKWRIQAMAAALVLSLASPATAFAAGWVQVDGGWRYQRDDGSYVSSALSPDGYYIGGSGIWKEYSEVLGVKLPNRNSFLRASQAGSLTNFSTDLTAMMQTIANNCGSVRSMAAQEQGISWYLYGSSEERELFTFYKDSETDGYTLRLKCSLSRTKGSKPRTSWYDYQVLSGILCKVSASGAQAAEAIYSSWKADNSYGLKSGEWTQVGDALIRYDSASGVGIYRIRAAGN